jgi:DNA transformation protein
MARENEFVAHVRDLLAPFGEGADTIRIRSMFGGFGVFLGDTMFALIADDVLYFKVDDQTVADFQQAGAEPFSYERGGKARQMSYYSAPDGALEDAEAVFPWAERAIGAAIRNRKR